MQKNCGMITKRGRMCVPFFNLILIDSRDLNPAAPESGYLYQSLLFGLHREVDEIRYWKIDGFGQVPCGGTHIRSTGELNAIRLKRDRQEKNKERIEIYPD